MWSTACEAVCRKHPELVAVYESPRGKLALLLEHTFMPSTAERARWFAETRRAARAIAADLKTAGTPEGITLLQWRPLPQVARVIRGWRRRYDGDPTRRLALTRLVASALLDPSVNGASGGRGGTPRTVVDALAMSRDVVTPTVLGWYGDMTPSWLAIEPRTRRLLVLQTHRWIVERVLAPIASGHAPAEDELTATGRLAWVLARQVPPGDLDRWKTWIRLTLRDLRRALGWPAERRNDAWVRWLFLIPYSIPVSATPATSPGVSRASR
jgi:hypothetical protein